MGVDDGEPLSLGDLIELDEDASPETNRDRARHQAAFHEREARELGELLAADPSVATPAARARDPRQAERLRHLELAMICREVVAAFDRLAAGGRPSRELGEAMEQLRAGYADSPEVGLLRAVAETWYPLLTTLTETRGNEVGLLAETKLSWKHAARGQALADSLDRDQAEALLAGWLAQAQALGARTVPILALDQALDWFLHLAAERARPDHGRSLEDDLEAMIYLARATLDETGFAYAGPDEPAGRL